MPRPIPNTTTLAAAVAAAHAKMLETEGGKNADYIPFLASVPSNLAGASIVTREGAIYEEGDSDFEFAFESISKIATLALAMEEIGPDEVQAKIGASPTGMGFNSVMALELHNDKPLSPLVNAGAISTASLVSGRTAEDRWEKILDMQSRLAGRQIMLSDEVNQSEQTTNYHNRAIAWLLYSGNSCYSDPMEALDIYTRQCSTLITARDLAVMGATLANEGINPVTGEQVLKPDNVSHILAEMMMEGLYTASGDFAYSVGLPGKSGVGGGILAVAPGCLSLAAFAPPLDDAGNSVRGITAVSQMAKSLNLNLFNGC